MKIQPSYNINKVLWEQGRGREGPGKLEGSVLFCAVVLNIVR